MTGDARSAYLLLCSGERRLDAERPRMPRPGAHVK